MLLLSRWSWRKHKTFVRGAKISDLRVSLGKARGEAGLSHPPPTPWWGGAGGCPSHSAGISVAGLFFLHSRYSFSVFHLLFKDPQLGQFSFFFCLSISTFIAMPFWISWTSGFFLIYVFPAWSCRYNVSPLDSTTTHSTSAIQFSTLFFTLFLFQFFFFFFLLITQLLAWLNCDRRSFGIFDEYIRR